MDKDFSSGQVEDKVSYEVELKLFRLFSIPYNIYNRHNSFTFNLAVKLSIFFCSIVSFGWAQKTVFCGSSG